MRQQIALHRNPGVDKMSLMKTALAAAVTLALGTAVTLAAPAPMKDGTAIVVGKGGAMKSMQVTRKQHARLMRAAKRLKPGTVFYMSGGKMFMAFDPNYNIMF